MTDTILLTGAGGAIGVHMLAHIMHNTDSKVIATGTFRNKGYYDRITRVCKNHPDWVDRIEILVHDLTVPFSSRQVEKLKDVTHVINLASLSDVYDSIENPVPFIRNNVDIALNMLELAREIKPKTFIQFSTDEVYGPCDVNSTGHKEWDTVLPSNPYAASKAAQEAIAISYWRSYGVPVILTNTMNNFGEMQGVSKFTAMIQKKLQEGEKVTVHAASDGQIGTRYYLHSRNASDAILHILNYLPATLHQPGEIDRPDRYNVVGDKQVSNLELAQTIADLMGKELDYELVDFHSEQPGHDLHYGLDDAKLKATGWESPSSFEESLKNTIDWQIRNPEWMK
jgi:dTDP-glucose 4,6-dehydratase